LKTLLNRLNIKVPLIALGVACGVVAIAYAALIVFEMVMVLGRNSPSNLPAPTARPVVALVVLAALVIGSLVARGSARRPEAPISPASIVAVLFLAIAISVFFYTTKERDQQYPSYASVDFPNTLDTTLKTDGHQACDWLRGRRWGAPPELGLTLQYTFNNAISVGKFDTAPAPTTHSTQSTNRLFTFYTRYLRRESTSSVLRPSQKLKRQVAYLAWYKMCPFQRWVHRPLGGHD
jgi:hypothetical protein